MKFSIEPRLRRSKDLTLENALIIVYLGRLPVDPIISDSIIITCEILHFGAHSFAVVTMESLTTLTRSILQGGLSDAVLDNLYDCSWWEHFQNFERTWSGRLRDLTDD